jgi:hypothetical protein
VRRPGHSTAPATSTRTWFQVDAVKQPMNGHIHSVRIRGTVSAMIELLPCLLNPAGQPGPAAEITMAARCDELRERIAAFAFPRGGVEVVRANRGYTLYSRRTGGPVARLRPTGQDDRVQVLWWRREAWAAPGDFGPVIMPLDQALEFIASEGFFWINA